MEALFRKALEKTQPFTDSKTLLKIPKLTPMVRLGNRTYRIWGSRLLYHLSRVLPQGDQSTYVGILNNVPSSAQSPTNT